MANIPGDPQEPPTTSIEDRDLPGLYRSADQASIRAQRLYLRLQKWHVGCLILGSVGAVFATLVSDIAVRWAYIALAIVLVTGVLLTWVSRVRRDNKTWFDCRAIAESTKTVAWRFMMKAAPFKDDNIARESFIDQLQRIRKEKHYSSYDLAQSLDANAQAIGDVMKRVRGSPLNERKSLYLVARLRDQKTWYSDKSRFNSKEEFLLVLGSLGTTDARYCLCSHSGLFGWLTSKHGPVVDDLCCFCYRMEPDEALRRVSSDLLTRCPGTGRSGSDCFGCNRRG